MSWSLHLRNGDIALDGAKLGRITGSDKLAQDLRCALLTKLGSDPQHPNYGSVIEGGRIGGREVGGVVGTPDWQMAAVQIESEIRRVARDYQSYQAGRVQSDQATYGRATLTPDEVLVSIESVDFVAVADTLLVNVRIATQAGNRQTLILPVQAQV